MEGEAFVLFVVIRSGSRKEGQLLSLFQVVAWQTSLHASRELPALGGRHLNAEELASMLIALHG